MQPQTPVVWGGADDASAPCCSALCRDKSGLGLRISDKNVRATRSLLPRARNRFSCFFIRRASAFGFALVPELFALGQGEF